MSKFLVNHGKTLLREGFLLILLGALFLLPYYDWDHSPRHPDEKIIPTFKRIYNIRDGITYEEEREGRSIDVN